MKSFVLTLLLGASLLPATETPLPKGEAIVDRYVEVTGGREAHEKRQTESFTAKLSMPAQGLSGTMVTYSAAPNKQLVVMEIKGVGKVESGTDGEVFWEKSAMQGARIRKKDELPQARRMALFNAALNWRKVFSKAETTGTDTVEGKLCYVVALTPVGDGKPEESCYEKESGLILRSKMTVKTPMGEVLIETLFSDHRKVGGVMMPHLITQNFAGQKMETTVETYTLNPELPANQFDLPEEVAKLAAKAAAANQ